MYVPPAKNRRRGYDLSSENWCKENLGLQGKHLLLVHSEPGFSFNHYEVSHCLSKWLSRGVYVTKMNRMNWVRNWSGRTYAWKSRNFRCNMQFVCPLPLSIRFLQLCLSKFVCMYILPLKSFIPSYVLKPPYRLPQPLRYNSYSENQFPKEYRVSFKKKMPPSIMLGSE